MEARMGQNVVYLHGKPEPVGHFLRIGGSGHRQLETLLGSGKLLTPAERSARNIAKLKVDDDGLRKVLEKSSERLEKMHSVLDDLSGAIKDSPRSRAPQRQPQGSSAAASRKK